MNNDTISQFKNELNSFFVLVLLNLTFGALTMAIGLQFMVTSVLGMTGSQTTAVFRILIGSFSLVCFGLGIFWVLSSAKILRGVTIVRRECKKRAEPITAEILTGWIMRIMAHYRENKKTIRLMTLVCALGGCTFLALGILNLIQGIAGGVLYGGMGFPALALIAAGINLTIGLASLIFSAWFHRYSAAWDRRVEEASRSEVALKQAMGQR